MTPPSCPEKKKKRKEKQKEWSSKVYLISLTQKLQFQKVLSEKLFYLWDMSFV